VTRSIAAVPGETEPDETADAAAQDSRPPATSAARDTARDTEDTATLTPRDRVLPTWTEPLARAGSAPLGGPLGVHAVIGRHWFWTPLRVALMLAVVGLALGWFGKAACVQQHYNEESKQLELDWRSNRPFTAMCY
jgi:hypothetical protein